MNDLRVFVYDNVDVVDSRSVARMVGKQHKHLLRDISGYTEILSKAAEPNFGPSDFFIESTYQDATGRTLPCYLLTKKGCDMVANKMTGEKGVLFTAAYVTAFEAMRRTQKAAATKPMTAYQRETISLQKARLLNQIATNYHGTTYEQVLQAHATKELTGEYLLPLPSLQEKTYSAKEVGDVLGISAHQVGALANKHKMKDDEHGQWFKDKSPYTSKEVSTFRYYEKAIEELRRILAGVNGKEA